MLIKTVELVPGMHDGRKSFYKKAYVEYTSEGMNGVCSVTLKSYGLPVARINGHGEFERLWSGYSDTTMRHINSFIRQYAANIRADANLMGGKKWWSSLPVIR